MQIMFASAEISPSPRSGLTSISCSTGLTADGCEAESCLQPASSVTHILVTIEGASGTYPFIAPRWTKQLRPISNSGSRLEWPNCLLLLTYGRENDQHGLNWCRKLNGLCSSFLVQCSRACQYASLPLRRDSSLWNVFP